MAGKIVNELQTLGGGVVGNNVLVPVSEDGSVLKKATVENINAITPTKPLKMYANDGTYGTISATYFSSTNDQQFHFYTNNNRGIFLSSYNNDKPYFWDGSVGHQMVMLKESWVSGASWYRLYSDGWLEQGGVQGGNVTITLYKSFRDTNYTITTSFTAAQADYYAVGVHINPGKTTSTFSASMWNNAAVGTFGSWNWVAVGYAA